MFCNKCVALYIRCIIYCFFIILWGGEQLWRGITGTYVCPAKRCGWAGTETNEITTEKWTARTSYWEAEIGENEPTRHFKTGRVRSTNKTSIHLNFNSIWIFCFLYFSNYYMSCIFVHNNLCTLSYSVKCVYIHWVNMHYALFVSFLLLIAGQPVGQTKLYYYHYDYRLLGHLYSRWVPLLQEVKCWSIGLVCWL